MAISQRSGRRQARANEAAPEYADWHILGGLTARTHSLPRDVHDLNGDLPTLIGDLDRPGLPRRLIGALGRLARIDCSLLLAFHDDAPPSLLFDDTAHAWRANTISEYLRAAYLLDPFYIAARAGIEPGVYRLSDLAPDGFTNSEYYSSYYARGHVEDEVCFLARIDDCTTLVLSLERRRDGGMFSDDDMRGFRDVDATVRALLCTHWRVCRLQRDPPPSAVSASIQRAYRSFGSSLLTPRECEVVRLLLEGHSTRSLAAQLEISPGTAKIHRERIYAKLGISGYAEPSASRDSAHTKLFHLFIDSVCAHPDDAAGDPLESWFRINRRKAPPRSMR
jgi:DNA-binding CsgD family transcriptional regulator